MSQTVAEYVIRKFSESGVKQVWGVTGDALNAFADAISGNDEINWIATRHEENAAFAAYAQAQLTGELAVCAGTVGPGALHLINGLYNAKKERVPVLALTGQVPVANQGSNYFQEVDLKKVFDDVCAYQGIITDPKQVPRMLHRAMQIAVNQRTVVRLEIAHDITNKPIENLRFDQPVFRSKAVLHCPDEDIDKAADLLNNSEKVCILAGVGALKAKSEVIRLSQKLKAPIVHTLKSSDIFDETIENVVGITGLIGNHSGYSAVMHCDVLLMVGTDFPYTNFLPEESKVIQIDIRPENIGNRVAVNLGIVGDALDVITRLNTQINLKEEDKYLRDHRSAHLKWRKSMTEQSSLEHDTTPLKPELFAKVLNERASSDAIFTIETGESAIWAAHHMQFKGNRRILGSFNHGSMAVGFPAALGAKAAFPQKEVWAMVGDGAFVMCMQDFITAVRYNWPLKVLIFNNSELSFVKMEMEEAGYAKNTDALKLTNPDFVEYAKSCGGDGIKVTEASQIENAFKLALLSDKPFIIDAVVSPGALSLPPTITFEEAWGFGVSKIKEGVLAAKGDHSQWKNIYQEIKSYFS